MNAKQRRITAAACKFCRLRPIVCGESSHARAPWAEKKNTRPGFRQAAHEIFRDFEEVLATPHGCERAEYQQRE